MAVFSAVLAGVGTALHPAATGATGLMGQREKIKAGAHLGLLLIKKSHLSF